VARRVFGKQEAMILHNESVASGSRLSMLLPSFICVMNPPPRDVMKI